MLWREKGSVESCSVSNRDPRSRGVKEGDVRFWSRVKASSCEFVSLILEIGGSLPFPFPRRRRGTDDVSFPTQETASKAMVIFMVERFHHSVVASMEDACIALKSKTESRPAAVRGKMQGDVGCGRCRPCGLLICSRVDRLHRAKQSSCYGTKEELHCKLQGEVGKRVLATLSRSSIAPRHSFCLPLLLLLLLLTSRRL